MGEKEPVLPASCVRALSDKLYDKRKTGALEVEKIVRDYQQQKNTEHIKKTLKLLGQDFALSNNPHSKKGGLIGLAACAIALGSDTQHYVGDLLVPILSCFCDPDSRIRYYACEAMYNVSKVARLSTLAYFNEIFDGLSTLAADPDQNVKHGSELLDRLMKDIVTENPKFDVSLFIPLLRDRIQAKNPFARQFLVSWISTLESVPDIDLVSYLPEFLDGLFCILGDSNVEIRRSCELCLDEFLHSLEQNVKKNHDSLPSILCILIIHCQSQEHLIQATAITWLHHLLSVAGSGLLSYTQSILGAVLPCLAYQAETGKAVEDRRTCIHKEAYAVNSILLKLVEDEKDEVDEGRGDAGDNLSHLNLKGVMQVLTEQLVHASIQTRVAVLRWIYHLLIKLPNRLFSHIEELFPVLLKTLSDPSDEVVLLDLEVLSEISSTTLLSAPPLPVIETPSDESLISLILSSIGSDQAVNHYFAKFIITLLRLFSTDRPLLDDRGAFIIRQLCLLLDAEHIYRAVSTVLYSEEDYKFSYHMVQTLNTILLTSTELFELRTNLKQLRTERSVSLFLCLYKCWCHNPVATISLCLLTQNYKHACDLLQMFGDLEVTVEFLTEIDKLIQLIESPVFTFLRLQLLNVEKNQYLLKSLYGLLMLLPQSDAFKILHSRLQCVPLQNMALDQNKLLSSDNTTSSCEDELRPYLKEIDFKLLITWFQDAQGKRAGSKKVTRVT